MISINYLKFCKWWEATERTALLTPQGKGMSVFWNSIAINHRPEEYWPDASEAGGWGESFYLNAYSCTVKNPLFPGFPLIILRIEILLLTKWWTNLIWVYLSRKFLVGKHSSLFFFCEQKTAFSWLVGSFPKSKIVIRDVLRQNTDIRAEITFDCFLKAPN